MTIELNCVSKTHGSGPAAVTALSNASLDIAAGEFVALVGPSGSGKSTMMNIMGLLDRPTSGEMRINGLATAGLDSRSLAQIRGRTIGLVFQSFHLLPRLTALQNVALPLRYQQIAMPDRLQRAGMILRRFGLESRMSHKPDALSGGQRQRVALARALVGEPSIILADEPTGNLDSKAAENVLDLLAGLSTAERPVTIVMVTHDTNLASRCSRTIELLDGQIVADTKSVAGC